VKGLLRVQSLGSTGVLKVLMIGPDQKRLPSTLQPVPPHLQHQLDSQQLPVANVVVSLCGGQSQREESTRVELVIDSHPLEQDSPYTYIGCIHLHNELAVWIRNLEDGGRGELVLEGLENHLSSPPEGHLGGCEGSERVGDGAVVLDEPAIKVGELQESL